MFIRQPFRVDDPRTIDDFMRTFDFVAVVSNSSSGLTASHVPVVVDAESDEITIRGHLARANDHWKLMDGKSESMAIFAGPHGYISPTWYAADGPAVPTWNYAVVHAYGRAIARDDAPFLQRVVEELTRRYEGHRDQPWATERLPGDSYAKLLRAIVGFEMRVERCEATFKLGQNRSEADRRGAMAGLDAEGSPASAALAAFMRRYAGVAQ